MTKDLCTLKENYSIKNEIDSEIEKIISLKKKILNW